MAEGVRVRRWRNVEDIIRELEPHEPASTLIVGPVVELGLGRHVKVWRAEDAQGRLLAALCTTRTCLDRWEAGLFELAPGAGPALRRLVQRLPVRRIMGPARVSLEILDGNRRVTKLEHVVWFDHPVPVVEVGEPDPRTRVAVPSDLPALVELYAAARQDLPPTRRRLGRYLRRLVVAGNVMLLLEDGELLGAVRIDWRSRRYGYMSANYVRSDRRGEGLSWPLLFDVMRVLRGWGLGLVAAKGDDNPARVRGQRLEEHRARMAERPDVVTGMGSWIDDPEAPPPDEHAWVMARLSRRSRVPGVAQAWRVLELIEGPVRT